MNKKILISRGMKKSISVHRRDLILYLVLLLFGARVVTFWRKIGILLLLFGARVVTFWRKSCYFLTQDNFVTHRYPDTYLAIILLINNLENNLINYSNKLFSKERGTSKKVFGTFWPTSFYVRQQCRIM